MSQKKELNFEINILPILDILSVLICFLLLTAVWMQLGTIDTKQAIGDNSVSGAQNPPSLWAIVKEDNSVELSLRDVKEKMPLEYRVASRGRDIDWNSLSQRLQNLKSQLPDLKTVVIRPEARTNYGNVIRMMDQMKQNQLTDIGLSPLG
ncbi:MAG: biopolymer transporter ExbD [Bdellovibrionaceae bacterium]|nr:biopolymer transporter ExbD [Pseudobdellovibrionaceae bacterium]MBX3034649.1 biopolymer transporter ExbD [Pseudobdellovibrionaceae bacterium]